MPTDERPVLVLPEDFDNYAWEVESKGVFWDVQLRYGEKEYPLTFYEPQRLVQDVADQLAGGPLFFERNMVVVHRVTKKAMSLAVEELIRTGSITGLAPSRGNGDD